MKFKNIEELWKYVKQHSPSGVQITSIEKSPAQKIFYLTVPKNLVTANKRKADYDYTFTETGGEIEVFIEPTNDSFTIIDTEDLKELIVFKMNESVNESSSYYNCTDSDIPGWDVKFEFDTSLSRKEIEDELKNTGFVRNRHYLLNVLPNHEVELYCKKKNTGQFTEFIHHSLLESQKQNNMSQQQLTQQEQQVVQKMCQGQQLTQQEQNIAQQAQQKLQQQLQQQQNSQQTNESEAQDKYREFFENKLKQYNVSSPNELSQEQKSKFFSEIKKEWGEQKGQLTEAVKASELSKDMMADFSSAEKKFIDEWIPGIKTYYQVYRGKALDACEKLVKKSQNLDTKYGLGGYEYSAWQSPNGTRFVKAVDMSFGDCFFIFATSKINEAEVMKGTGKIYYTGETVGQLSDTALQDAIRQLGDTMSQLSNDPTEDSIKAYKECEDSYQCLKSELSARGLENVN